MTDFEKHDRILKHGYYSEVDIIREQYLKSKGWESELIRALFRCDLPTQTEIIQAEIIKDLIKHELD